MFLEYPIRLDASGEFELEVHLVPTLDTLGREGQRFGLQLDGGPIETITVQLEPTGGGPDTPLMQAWYDAVIANRIEATHKLPALAKGQHSLRFYRIDDNVVPQAFLLRPVASGPAGD